MDSIKNAIVTVTLLAVGYGSYVVLQDDVPAKDAVAPSTKDVASDNDSAVDGEMDLKVEVGEPELAADPPASFAESRFDASPFAQEPAEPAVGAQQEFAAGGTASASPLPDSPFDYGSSPTMIEPPANASPPPTDFVAESAAAPSPHTGPFASPVILPANATANHSLDANRDASVVKRDAAVASPPVEAPAWNDPVGPIPPATSAVSADFEQAWTLAQQQIRQQAISAALATLSPWTTDRTLNPEQRELCLNLADQLAGTVIYSREHHLEPEYVVRAGETLAEIAARFEVPQELLAKINGIAPPFALATGEKLKVMRGPFRAEIGISAQELVLFLGPHYAGRFSILMGPDVPPEEAVYEIAEKTNGRSYFDRRTGHEVAVGHTANRYGSHWLGLRGEHITAGHSVGIHGRPPELPPQHIGSMSLDPRDAEDVYSILSVGSQVMIRP